MAKGFDTLHIKSAVKSHNKFDLSHSHLTTMNFGEIVPLFAEEVVAGDKFNVSADYFSRMAPLVRPTYGKFSFNTVASYVPYHQVCDGIDGFMAGNQYWEGHTCASRYITWAALCDFVINVCSTQSSAATASASTDFTYIASNGTRTYCKLTHTGKYYVKVLNALGYNLPQNVSYVSGSNFLQNVAGTYLSALPLLAFFKAYNDYMSQSQRFNSSQLTAFLNNIKHDIAVTGLYTATYHEITSSGLNRLFSNLFLQYENDYFTSAWRYPSNPIGITDNGYSLSVKSSGVYQDMTASVGNNDTVSTVSAGGNLSSLNQRAMDILKALDDWARRNNYAGTRAVQRIYSRFGVKTDDYKSNYAHILSTNKQGVNVGDITSVADTKTATEGSYLGDYAGKGIMNGNGGFQVDCTDYGMLFIFGYFTVSPMNAYGCDRAVLRVTPEDFYNPEFDGLGGEAISYAELFENPKSPSGDTYAGNQVYGFTERYNSYRYGRDKITGEFRGLATTTGSTTAATDWNVWHTGRDLSAVRAAGNMIAQSTSMNSLSQTDSEYNRMFSIPSGDEDKFYLTAQFRVSAVRPMLSLNQVPRLGEGDTVVEKNGNTIN